MASRWMLVKPTSKTMKRRVTKRKPDVQRLLEADLAAQVAKSDEPGRVKLDRLGAMRMADAADDRPAVIFERADGTETGRFQPSPLAKTDNARKGKGLFDSVVFAKSSEPFKPTTPRRDSDDDVRPLFVERARRRR